MRLASIKEWIIHFVCSSDRTEANVTLGVCGIGLIIFQIDYKQHLWVKEKFTFMIEGQADKWADLQHQQVDCYPALSEVQKNSSGLFGISLAAAWSPWCVVRPITWLDCQSVDLLQSVVCLINKSPLPPIANLCLIGVHLTNCLNALEQRQSAPIAERNAYFLLYWWLAPIDL